MPEFKISKGYGDESTSSTVSISPLAKNKFDQIKRHLAFSSQKEISSQEVMEELIETWYQYRRGEVIGDTN